MEIPHTPTPHLWAKKSSLSVGTRLRLRTAGDLLLAHPGRRGNVPPLSGSLFQKLIYFLKAKLVAAFFILTASETQIDFVSHWLFPVLFWGEFHFVLLSDQPRLLQ